MLFQNICRHQNSYLKMLQINLETLITFQESLHLHLEMKLSHLETLLINSKTWISYLGRFSELYTNFSECFQNIQKRFRNLKNISEYLFPAMHKRFRMYFSAIHRYITDHFSYIAAPLFRINPDFVLQSILSVHNENKRQVILNQREHNIIMKESILLSLIHP